jgi:hypothetical protein
MTAAGSGVAYIHGCANWDFMHSPQILCVAPR